MKKAGYALISKADGAALEWWESIPQRIDFPDGDVVFGVNEGWESDGYKIIAEERQFADPPDIDPVLPAPLITRRQLLIGLMSEGFITSDECVDAASGAVPTAVQEIFDTMITDPVERTKAIVTWATVRDVLREDSLTKMLQASRNLSDAELDAMWARWAEI